MKKKISILAALLLLGMLFTACGENGLTDPMSTDTAQVSFNVTVASQTRALVNIGTLVTSGTIRLARGAMVRYVNLTIAGSYASAVVPNLLVGNWHADVQLYDADGLIIYSGSADFTIYNGTTTQIIELALVRHQGTALFGFELPTEVSEIEGLVFWSKMGSISELTNLVGGAGIIKGAASSFVEGKWGQGLYGPRNCDGSNMDRLPGGIFNLRLFTVEFWVKASPLADAKARSPFSRITATAESFNIVHRNGYAGWYNTAYSVTDNNGNQIAYLVEHTNQAGNNAYLPVGEWVHFAMTVDMNLPDGEKIRIYRNGIRQATTILHNIGDMPDKPCMEPVIINGSFRDNEGSELTLDNVKFYNYAKNVFDLTRE